MRSASGSLNLVLSKYGGSGNHGANLIFNLHYRRRVVIAVGSYLTAPGNMYADLPGTEGSPAAGLDTLE